jgi:hypothetical protein
MIAGLGLLIGFACSAPRLPGRTDPTTKRNAYHRRDSLSARLVGRLLRLDAVPVSQSVAEVQTADDEQYAINALGFNPRPRSPAV